MKKLLALVLSAVMCFSLAFAASAEETAAPDLAAGGWQVNEDILTDPMPDDAAEIFAKAMEGFVGVGYEPIAVLGAQVVAGLNIAYLCKATTVTANPEVKLAVVVVYHDLQDNASILNISDLDLGKFLEVKESSQSASGEEVEFQLIVANTLTEEADEYVVSTTAATLGDFMRSWEDCKWEDSEYGIFVTEIGGVANDDDAAAYWSYYVNGEYAMVGADECILENGMEITWAYETFVWEE